MTTEYEAMVERAAKALRDSYPAWVTDHHEVASPYMRRTVDCEAQADVALTAAGVPELLARNALLERVAEAARNWDKRWSSSTAWPMIANPNPGQPYVGVCERLHDALAALDTEAGEASDG